MTCYPCGHTSEKRWECSIGEITFLAKLAYSTRLSLINNNSRDRRDVTALATQVNKCTAVL